MGFIEEIHEYAHAKVLVNHSMRKHTGYGVGGCAKYYVEVDSLYSLNESINICNRYKTSYKIIGNGTNVLVGDKGYNGLIINTKKLNDVFFKKDQIRAMAGAQLNKVIKFAMEHSLSGLESLYGIPATVGGAVVMNAGAFGHSIGERITAVETLADSKIKKYTFKQCEFGYRKSRFYGIKEVVVSATFNLFECEKELINASLKGYEELRRNLQPKGKSCGSVFKNPLEKSAGQLIEQAGLKGLCIGGATVSTKHANFITTTQKATAMDVKKLIKQVKTTIKKRFNVNLTEEIEYVGEF